MRRLFVAVLFLVTLGAFAWAWAGEEASFPELKAFHDLIAKAWHTHYPQDDFASLRKMAPDFVKAADVLVKAKLPPTLQKRQSVFDMRSKVLALKADEFAATAKKNDDAALKKATVALHEAFHDLVSGLYSKADPEEGGECTAPEK
jgi:hypothetical protein